MAATSPRPKLQPRLSDSKEMDNYKVKLLCSYGGTIRDLKPDNKISYVDGHTKVLYVDRNINIYDMLLRLSEICLDHVTEFKYQFPSKDDNILITVHEKGDLKSMMREYDKIYDNSNTTPVMRLFITPYLLSRR